LIKVDVATQKVVGTLALPKLGKALGKPQDVKLSPDGRIFYIADMNANGVYEVDGATMKLLGFIPTGKNAHGLYVSRDSKVLYVSNRGEGSVSLIDFATRKRESRHGRGVRRRNDPVADRAEQLRGIRDQHLDRPARREGEGGQRAARAVPVASAGPVLARPHRHPPLSRGSGPSPAAVHSDDTHRCPGTSLVVSFENPGKKGSCQKRWRRS
jgi:hypothetical protein